MKTIPTCLLMLFTSFLYAQQKGVAPIPNSTLSNTQSTYAVVVGISDYQDEGIPDLRFADKDAEAFAAFLQSPAGGSLDDDHLKVLTNEAATGARIAIALDWLVEVAGEGDQVFIYFSGHGDVEAKRITQPGYLLGWDAPSRVYMAGGAVNVRDLQIITSTLSVENKAKVFLITDACRSGKLSGSEIDGAQLTSQHLARQFDNEIKILSCQPNEYSIKGEQWGGGRGAFSYHLVDGLYGMADGNGDLSVSLMEMGRYLQDNVTIEVAPESQVPMTVGNYTEKLVQVNPDLLEQIKDGKKGQLQMFTPTESRGIEDNVLAAADSNIVEMYAAFQKAVEEKQFLEPASACADFYYEKLSKEPQMERLHSTMRRNYAAALQDDAQQVLNTMLKTGLTEQVLKGTKAEDIYKSYPEYLERAAVLLGKEHYMYASLQARKLFFEGMIQKERKEKSDAYRKALIWQPEMAHAMVYLAQTFEAEQLDSAEFYFQKAIELLPSWVMPYIGMADFYRAKLKDTEKEEEMLNLAGLVDSTSALVWFKKARFYYRQKRYNAAEEWYLKTIEGTTGEDICFPCVHLSLGALYTDIFNNFEKGEDHFKKALHLDSISSKEYISFCRPCAYSNLGTAYHKSGRVEESILNLKKAIELDSTLINAYNGLAIIYSSNLQDNEKAEKMLLKVVELNPNYAPGWVNLGLIYHKTNRPDKAEDAFGKALKINHHYATPFAHNGLGELYSKQEKFEEAEDHFKKTIELNPQLISAYQGLSNVYIKTGNFNAAMTSLDKALEINPDHPITYILYARCEINNNQPEKAWNYLKQSLEKGYNAFEFLQSEPDFEELRKDSKWNELLKKYFPDRYKD